MTKYADGSHRTSHYLVTDSDGSVLAWWPIEEGTSGARRMADDTGHDLRTGYYTGQGFVPNSPVLNGKESK